MKRSGLTAVIAAAAVAMTVFLANHFLTTATAQASDAPTTLPATSPAAEKSVDIDNFKFKPQELTISVGTKVTWTNKDDVPHTATSSDDPPAFDSKTIDTDDKYSFTFTKTGTYKYFCKVHPHMTATIIVK